MKRLAGQSLRSFAANVRARREARGWTQADLAEAADLDVRQVRRVESGRVNFGVLSLLGIARALEVDLDVLAREVPLERRPPGRPRLLEAAEHRQRRSSWRNR